MRWDKILENQVGNIFYRTKNFVKKVILLVLGNVVTPSTQGDFQSNNFINRSLPLSENAGLYHLPSTSPK